VGLEVVEPALPLLAERSQPGVDVLQRADDQFAGAPLCVLAVPDEPGLLEDPQVLRDRRLAQPERSAELGHRRRPVGEPREDGAARGICERGEGPIEERCVHCQL
jgi:hypothetical protein